MSDQEEGGHYESASDDGELIQPDYNGESSNSNEEEEEQNNICLKDPREYIPPPSRSESQKEEEDEEEIKEEAPKLKNKDIVLEFDSDGQIHDQSQKKEKKKGRKYIKQKRRQIKGNERTCNPFVNKFQKARILSIRTNQIAKGSAIYCQITQDDRKKGVHPLELAQREYFQGKIPFLLVRHHTNGDYQVWPMQDLVLDVWYSELNLKLWWG